jgi:diadenosine tetraphosphatase ApaH/serine/threonine PP2A family protein phosphatase
LRIAVISDVHANLRALERVLESVSEAGIDVFWSLGDTVGYGPRPNECCAVVEEQAGLCLVGNHDLLALGKAVLEGDFNPDAATAGAWTRAVLDERARSFLERLEPQAAVPEAELFHGSARDPVWEYVLSGEAALATLELTTSRLVLVGHSHVPLAISLAHGRLSGGHAPAGTEVDLGHGRWLLNPGSVGQPRDGDPHAAWLELDTAPGKGLFRRVEYDIDGTQAEIRDAGLPPSLAARLAQGI